MPTSSRTTPRVRASELVGRGWLNTGGCELTLQDLRGKIVLLDVWKSRPESRSAVNRSISSVNLARSEYVAQ